MMMELWLKEMINIEKICMNDIYILIFQIF